MPGYKFKDFSTEAQHVMALHTPPETSSVSLVMSRKRNVGAIMIVYPLPGSMPVQHTEQEGFTVHTWGAPNEQISYIYPAPSVKQAIESAWSHGAYDIRIIVDAPKDLRSSGSIVSFAGRPSISLERMSMDSPAVIDWGHIGKVQEEVNWLIDAASLDGHYRISWRPNYGTELVLAQQDLPVFYLDSNAQPQPAFVRVQHEVIEVSFVLNPHSHHRFYHQTSIGLDNDFLVLRKLTNLFITSHLLTRQFVQV